MVVLEYFRFQRFDDDSEPVLQCATEAPADVSEWCYPAGIFVVMLFVSFCHQTGKPVAPFARHSNTRRHSTTEKGE